MRKFLIASLLLIIGTAAHAQVSPQAANLFQATPCGTTGYLTLRTLCADDLPAGSSATNIGTLSGDLTGTLPAPAIAAGAVTSAKMATGAAATNVGALSGDLTGSLPSQTIAKIQGTTVSGTTGAGKAVLSGSPVFSGDIGVIGSGLTAVTAADRAPLFVWENCTGTITAGRDCGLQIWVGDNPTATPAANSPVAATIVMTNGNNRGSGPKLLSGLNVVTVQCGTAEGCTTGYVDSPSVVAEFDGSNSNSFTAANRAFLPTTGTYAKNILELYNSPSVGMLTNALSIWSTDSTGVGDIYTGIEMARVKDIGLRFVVNPVGGTDTGTFFTGAAIQDDSNSANFIRFGNFTHSGSLINMASGATFTGAFYLGNSGANTSVLLANNAAFDMALTIDSGVSAGTVTKSIINFNDRGATKYQIFRDTNNSLYILNSVTGNKIFQFDGDNQIDPNPVTVGTLPACTAGLKFGRRTVSDAAAAPVYNATAAGGGSIALPVMCDGTNWKNR